MKEGTGIANKHSGGWCSFLILVKKRRVVRRVGLLLLAVVLLVTGILASCGGTAMWHYLQGSELAEQGRYDEAMNLSTKAAGDFKSAVSANSAAPVN